MVVQLWVDFLSASERISAPELISGSSRLTLPPWSTTIPSLSICLQLLVYYPPITPHP